MTPIEQSTGPAEFTQVVILLGNKLIGTDTIVPVALKLARERPHLKFRFVVLDGRHRPGIERNYVLWSAIGSLGEVQTLSNGGKDLKSRAEAAWMLLRVCMWVLSRRTLLMGACDYHRFPFSWLLHLTHLRQGLALTYQKSSFSPSAAMQYIADSKPQGRPNFANTGDGHLVYHPSQDIDQAKNIPLGRVVIGTTRGFRAWRDHLESISANLGVRDEEGLDLRTLASPLVVVFFPGYVEIPSRLDDPTEKLLLVLKTVASEWPESAIIIKPHPNCDLDRLRADVKSVNIDQVRIGHAHPQLLIRLAEVVITVSASNVMYDAYLERKGVIEVVEYRPDILKYGNSVFPIPGLLSAKNETELRTALAKARKAGPVETIENDPIYWPEVDGIFQELSAAGSKAC